MKYLKPCPFCGYDKPMIIEHPMGGFQVHCPRYACSQSLITIYPSKEQTIKMWNEMKRE